MRVREGVCGAVAAVLLALPASAQPMLYSQRLPEGTVYIRLVSALPEAASVTADFAGTVTLGDSDASRVSAYFVAGNAGGKTVALQVKEGAKTATATIQPKSGTFVTVALYETSGGVSAAVITDKPEYNQLKARLTFYDLVPDCTAGSLLADGKPVFTNVGANAVQARSVNPSQATVVAACGNDKAKPLDLGKLNEGGLYSVYMMRLGGQLTSFMAKDTIALPRT